MEKPNKKPLHLFVLQYFEEIVAIFVFSGIFVSQSFQVFFRYVLQSPLTWTEELSRILFIWLGFFGSVIVTKHKGHLSVDLLVNYLPDIAGKVINVVIQSLVILFLAVIAVFGINLTIVAKAVTTPALEISVGYIYLPVPVFAVLTIIRMVGQFLHEANKAGSSENPMHAHCRKSEVEKSLV